MCCKNLHSTIDGAQFGLYLSPEESRLFAPEAVVPLFRRGSEVVAYQVRASRCPQLQGNLCRIYDDRPLACRAFPLGENGIKSCDCSGTLDDEREALRQQSEERIQPDAVYPLGAIDGH